MKRRWLRWVGLFLLIEGCLYLTGACRPCYDVQGEIDRSPPLLLTRGETLGVSLDGRMLRRFEINDELTQKLEAFVLSQNKSMARRTRAGQLLDDHGRVLLGAIGENDRFAYNPDRDVLAWWCGADLCLREGSDTRRVRTWTHYLLIKVNPDGTVWISEDNPMHTGGIAALDRTGRFLGWRARGYQFAFFHEAAEPDDSVMPLVEKLLARSRDKDKKGF